MIYTIYALLESDTGAVRYIGITKRALQARFKQHLKLAKAGKHYPVCRWIRKLLADDRSVNVFILETTDDLQRECFWIKSFRDAGSVLLNLTSGGDGVNDLPAESRARMGNRGSKHHLKTPEGRAMVSARFKGKPLSEEQKTNISASKKGKVPYIATPEIRAKLSAAHKGFKHTEEFKQKMRGNRYGAANKGRKLSPEHCAKISEGQRARWARQNTYSLYGFDEQ